MVLEKTLRTLTWEFKIFDFLCWDFRFFYKFGQDPASAWDSTTSREIQWLNPRRRIPAASIHSLWCGCLCKTKRAPNPRRAPPTGSWLTPKMWTSINKGSTILHHLTEDVSSQTTETTPRKMIRRASKIAWSMMADPSIRRNQPQRRYRKKRAKTPAMKRNSMTRATIMHTLIKIPIGFTNTQNRAPVSRM